MRKGDEARRELLRRAAELFDQYGYETVSVKDIADSLGWPKSLFYYYCPSKEQLVLKAAQARAAELLGMLNARMEGAEGSVERLRRALDCAGFWACGGPKEAAHLIKTLYRPESLPWRMYLRAHITPELGKICNDIIACGVKEYEMYTPYPLEMGETAAELAADLSEKLAALLLAGSPQSIERADALLQAYRCAIERLVEAPFGSLRLTELSFLRDTAREMGVDFGGGANHETRTDYNTDDGDAAERAGDNPG